MNRTTISLLILCIAAALSPQVALAQVDPGSPNQQPNQTRSIPDSTSIPGDSAQEARRLVGAKGKGQLLQELAEFVA